MFFKKKSDDGKKKKIRRLKILRGQIDGILKMVERDAPCEEVFPQIKAVQNAFLAFSKEAAKDYFFECRGKKMSESENKKLFETLFLFLKK